MNFLRVSNWTVDIAIMFEKLDLFNYSSTPPKSTLVLSNDYSHPYIELMQRFSNMNVVPSN